MNKKDYIGKVLEMVLYGDLSGDDPDDLVLIQKAINQHSEIEDLKAENQRMQMAIHFCSGSCGHIQRDATFIHVTSCDDCYFVDENLYGEFCDFYQTKVESSEVKKSIHSGKVPENCPLSKGVLFLASNS